jgi:hypothetical protein
MSRQVQEHFDQVVKSEMSLRTLNQKLSASESRYRGLVDHAPIGIFTTKGMQVRRASICIYPRPVEQTRLLYLPPNATVWLRDRDRH